MKLPAESDLSNPQPNMKSTASFLVAAAALGLLGWSLLRPAAPRSGAAATAPPEDHVRRGAYLVKLGGCTDCHTPKTMTPQGPVDDPRRFLAGHPADLVLSAPSTDPSNPWGAATAGMTAWTGPWGVTYSANLTPDPDTGLGAWTEAEFISAMRTGKHKGSGRPILPPMPWQPLSEAKEEDLSAIYAYLMSLPAVVNRVPDPVPPATALND
ncbi:c-type cytochrome [Luteolibacter marinus]|uniref:c-type cytochrome n=1 Tax=Luteolibacter marinus TaxID=2776705 RepID=UPI001D00DEDE|nr:c-type cytochrome [Luteolibacter marinus]